MYKETQFDLSNRRFIQIPGPNPILVESDEEAWDGKDLEASDILKDDNTYYLYYHAHPGSKSGLRRGYRIGVANAPHPLGPWTKYEKNPVIDWGPEGSFDYGSTACASVIKEDFNKYYMWYETGGGKNMCLAYASNPLGPWEKYKGNPTLEDFGYIGGVVKANGKYYMYDTHPLRTTGPDYGPVSLATADSPEGPWTKYEGNPVLAPGDWGSWDDGGFSEAKVTYHEGIFHIFYGGAHLSARESIGYAYSFDGYKFIKHIGNPIALRERNPGANSLAEVKSLFEYPFIYLYHTLKYKHKGGEDLGVQILATETPFCLVMPVLSIDSLGAGTSSGLTACPPISLGCISDAAITVECVYHHDAKKGLKVHVKSSYDGINYDTEDLSTSDILFSPGQRVSKTIGLDANVMFIKVIAENSDSSHDITNVKVTATLGSS